MKKVLLIGDSITGGYTQKVTELLDGKYEVYKVPDNCRFSAYTLNCSRFWLGQQKLPEIKFSLENPDIIHWNNGLWDCLHLDANGNILEDKFDVFELGERIPTESADYTEFVQALKDYYAEKPTEETRQTLMAISAIMGVPAELN